MKELLRKYNIRAPRYTSYPPANKFHDQFDPKVADQLIADSNQEDPANISMYFHFPYCPQTCFFCGCNSYLKKSDEEAGRYINSLLVEVGILLDKLDLSRPVTQIHWGGGTPNSLDYRLLGKVMDSVLSRVTLSENAEIAIECNPAYLTRENIPALRDMGFNRLSLGIQDFNNDVLKAVNREPSLLDLEELMELIRKNEFSGVNFDFIYGLPLQNVPDFIQGLEKAVKLRPDRLVTFSYAHVPWVKSEQNRMNGLLFPSPEEKLDMLVGGMETLTGSGYRMIGMDHYALAEDSLGKASMLGQLHRNFQGYCTRETTGQVYAFGASSISQLTNSYLQNIRHPEKYQDALSDSGNALQRGYILNEDEKIIREAITEIMCNGYLSFEGLGNKFGRTGQQVMTLLNYSKEAFKDLEEDQLLEAGSDHISLFLPGKLLSRVIAMRLDPNLGEQTAGFSQTI